MKPRMLKGSCRYCDQTLIGDHTTFTYHIYSEHKEIFKSHFDKYGYNSLPLSLKLKFTKEQSFEILLRDMEDYESEQKKLI